METSEEAKRAHKRRLNTERKRREREKNPEKVRRYREENRDAFRAADKRHAAKKRAAGEPRWSQLHPERSREIRKLSYAKSAKKAPWKYYRKNAKVDGREWTFSDEFCEVFMKQACHYCGVFGDPYVGIDRKDSSLGYVHSNVLPACSACNWAKNNTSYEDFVAWIKRAAKHIEENKL